MIKMMLFLCSLALIGCNLTFSGTNTGNPDLTSSPINGTDGALKLGLSVCKKIKSCHQISDVNACMNQIVSLAGYPSELGLTAGNYSTLTDLRNAEIKGEVTPNKTNFENCEQAIQTSSCSDPLTSSAYSISTPDDYAKTNLLFRSSGACSQIY